jgi:hypothetical protein
VDTRTLASRASRTSPRASRLSCPSRTSRCSRVARLALGLGLDLGAWAGLAAAAPAQVTLHFEDALGSCSNAGFVEGTTSWSGSGVSILAPDVLATLGADHTPFETDALHVFTFGPGTSFTFPEPMRRLKLDVASMVPVSPASTYELLANGVQVATFGADTSASTLVDVPLDPPAASVTIRHLSGGFAGLLIDRLLASPEVSAPPGLGFWRMEPTLPADVVEDSLHGHDGVLLDAAVLEPGVFGSALSVEIFVPGCLEVPDADALDIGPSTAVPGSGDFSIACWLRATESSGAKAVLDKRDFLASRGYHLYIWNGGLGVQLADGTYDNYTSPTLIADGTWHHVAVTVDRDQPDGIRFYKDGVLLPETFDPTNHPGDLSCEHDLWIGQKVVGGTMPGSIDDLFLAGRVLSQQEIATLHSGAAVEHPHAWADLGAPLAGADGDPLLVGTGTLEPAAPGALTLTHAAADAPILLFIALASTPTAFKGGLLKPIPFLLTYDFTTLQDGSFELPFFWPAGVPSGLPFYYQFAIEDAAAVNDVALSNTVMGLTP